MKFCICVKQVADVSAPIQVRDGALMLDPNRLVLNAYDASAVEEALVLREKYGGEIDVVLVGPDRAQEALRKTLAMGADRAVHLRLESDADYDARAYADILAGYLREAAYDVIACGKQAQDTDAGLTGSMLADLLGVPYATNAVGLDVDPERKVLVVTRQGDTGQEIIELATPCLVTCSNDMNDPRIPNLKGIMAAKRKTIEVRPVPAPGSDRPVTRHVAYRDVPEREPGRMLDGDPADLAQQLRRLLAEEARVL